MKITYIYHSCYLVELEHTILLFDYYKGILPKLDPKKHLYVFATHRHQDHFSRKIFVIDHPQITYILSDDIPLKKDVIRMSAHQNLNVDDMHISTLLSTDEGVAFIVQVEGKIVYHAGDLNWWDWGEEDSEEESRDMKEAYQKELEILSRYKVDVAFLPVDARLKENFYKGLDACMGKVDISVVFPMHFWDDYTIVKKLFEHPVCQNYKNRIQKVLSKNQTFLL